jgi:hypothetical protein
MKQARTMRSTLAELATPEGRRAWAIAGATGRSAEDRARSLIAGEVVGRPVGVSRNDQPSFRAALHGTSGLTSIRGWR